MDLLQDSWLFFAGYADFPFIFRALLVEVQRVEDTPEEAAVADTVLWISGRVLLDVSQTALVPVLVRISFNGARLRGLPR